MATFNVSTDAEIATAISNATGGDTISVATGSYSLITVSGKDYGGSYVTLTSADGNRGAEIAAIRITTSSYFAVDGVSVIGSVQTSGNKIYMNDVDFIKINDCEIAGTIDSNVTDFKGVYGDNNGGLRDIIISNNDIHHCNGGVWLYQTDGLLLSNNDINYCGDDALKFSSLNDYIIELNRFTDIVRDGTKHADFMQFESSSGSTNGIIRKNVQLLSGPSNFVYVESTYAGAQGIFHNAGPAQNVTVEDNIIYTAHINAIKFRSTSTNCTIQRNSVIHAPTALYSTQHKYSSIQGGTNLIDNLWSTATGSQVGLTAAGLRMSTTDPGSQYYQSDMITNPDAGYGVTLEDLLPIVGTAAEFLGADTYLKSLTGSVGSAPTAGGNLANQSFGEYSGSYTYATAFDFTGADIVYSINSVSGVTIDSATGVITFDTNVMAAQAGTAITVTATNATSPAATSTFDLSIAEWVSSGMKIKATVVSA